MGLINNLKDRFVNAEFSVAPQKKVKTVCLEFKRAFGLTLAIYKGSRIADPELTLSQLNKLTTSEIATHTDTELKIKASMKVGEVNNLFNSHFGLTVRVKDPDGKVCVGNELTLGQAARGEVK